MAIAHVQLWWLERLHRLGVFQGKRSILEIGPQDLFFPTLGALANFVTGVTGKPCSEADANRLFFRGQQLPCSPTREWLKATHALYALLGPDEYYSTDLYDIRADWHFDLNHPVPIPRKFDVITQMGTIEHVFDIAESVRFIHDHTNVGGVILHVLPTRGDYNHGFYNFHSTWFRDLAAANRYEIVDMVNVPDVSRQNQVVARVEQVGKRPDVQLFTDIKTADDPAREASFIRDGMVELDRLAREGTSQPAGAVPRGEGVADHIYVAYRKTADAPFVKPQQSAWGNPSAGPIISDDPDLHLKGGWDHFRNKRWPEAGVEARATLALRPDCPSATHLLGAVALKTHYPADAAIWLTKALQMMPEDPQILCDLGLLMNDLGRYGEALDFFKHAIKLRPDLVEAYQNALGALAVQHSRDPGNASRVRELVVFYKGVANAHDAHGEAEAAREARNMADRLQHVLVTANAASAPARAS